jgi:stearoyl-CoA desaturase (delta-9 desaturase)
MATVKKWTQSVFGWFDTSAYSGNTSESGDQIDWVRALPYILIHVACLGVLIVGVSAFAVVFAIALYLIRMFAITAFYHRYFSHKTFKTSRGAQFVFAVMGASAAQRGPIWWASHHRHHHVHSDREDDSHSPHLHSFLWSHGGWFLSRANFASKEKYKKDLEKYPELVWLDRLDAVIPLLLAIGVYFLGETLAHFVPSSGTNGPQLLVWGFFISTVLTYHATYSVNSLAHMFGKRRFDTRDKSRNNWFVALITLGEGWHNNHHFYPASARQGYGRWEIDPTYSILRFFEKLGLIWDLKEYPHERMEKARVY